MHFNEILLGIFEVSYNFHAFICVLISLARRLNIVIKQVFTFISNITGLAHPAPIRYPQKIPLASIGIYHLDLMFVGFFPIENTYPNKPILQTENKNKEC